MRGLLVCPLEMSTHLDKPPRTFFLSGLLNEMVTIPTAANNAIPYISRIRNVYFGSFSGAGCTDTAVLYGRCDPGSAVSTRGPKAGQRAAAGCDAARTHAGGAVLTFAQQQQQAAGSSSLSLHVLLSR